MTQRTGGSILPPHTTFTAISQSYERPRYDDWPYNLFTMIHPRIRDECDAFVAQLAATHCLVDHAVLYSTANTRRSA